MALPGGGVDHLHLALGGRLHIDVVHADAGPAHDLEGGGLGQDVRRDLGRRPDRQTLVAPTISDSWAGARPVFTSTERPAFVMISTAALDISSATRP
jgi:hypothetical protein